MDIVKGRGQLENKAAGGLMLLKLVLEKFYMDLGTG
jgi:hypothetical protein